MKTWEDYGIHISGIHAGENYTTCPKCSKDRSAKNRNKKCLSVNVEKKVWICHHCGWAGALDKGEYKNNQLHWQKPRYSKPEWKDNPNSDQRMAEFFADRRISMTTVRKFGVCEKSVYMPQLENHTTAIAFPYLRDGEVVNVKYRDYEKNFRLEAGAERLLYNLPAVIDQKTIIITEGEMDVLALSEAGFDYVCSVPDGAPAVESEHYESKFTFLEAINDLFKQAEAVILAVDNDPPGLKLEEELARRIGKEKCLRVRYPAGCKDANDVLMWHGKERLQEVINEAKPFPVHGIITVPDIYEDYMNLYENGYRRGCSTGWNNVDKLITLRRGELTILTGIPSHGKSEWLDALLVNLHQKDDSWRWAVFAPENEPCERHLVSIAEKYIGKPFDKERKTNMQKMTKAEAHQGAVWASNWITFLSPDEELETFSLDDILDLARTTVYRYGITGIVIDPWNDLDYTIPQNLNETQWIAQCLVKCRNFARHHNVHFVIVAHPTKLGKEKTLEGEKEKVPTPYDISGSANWRNKADNCIAVWRDIQNRTNEVQVHVQKIKFKEVGRIGMERLYYCMDNGRYYENQIDLYQSEQVTENGKHKNGVPF